MKTKFAPFFTGMVVTTTLLLISNIALATSFAVLLSGGSDSSGDTTYTFTVKADDAGAAGGNSASDDLVININAAEPDNDGLSDLQEVWDVNIEDPSALNIIKTESYIDPATGAPMESSTVYNCSAGR